MDRVDGTLMKKAEFFAEIFPYIREFQGKYFVIKVGGSISRISDATQDILFDCAFLKLVGINPIIVCGGGPFITDELEKRGKKAEFMEGLRITDKETLNIVDEVLSGVRDRFTTEIKENFGIDAVALKPEENYIFAKPIHYQQGEEVVDLGFVGQVDEVNVEYLKQKSKEEGILVIAPLAYSKNGDLYNINGDSVAASIAQSLNVEKLIFLTAVRGVMRHPEKAETLISVLTMKQVEDLIKSGIIKEGMIPKVKAAVSSIKKGVGKVHIISGNVPHSILLEIFTVHGVGTEIVRK